MFWQFPTIPEVFANRRGCLCIHYCLSLETTFLLQGGRFQGCRQRGFGESVTSRTAISWDDGKGRSEDSRAGKWEAGGVSWVSGLRVEARTCDTQLSSEAHPDNHHFVNLVHDPDGSPFLLLPSVSPAPPTSGLSQACTPKSAASHSDPLKILPSRNARRCIGKSRKELVVSARLPLQAAQVVLQRYCMTVRQAKRRLPSSLRRPVVGQRRMIIP